MDASACQTVYTCTVYIPHLTPRQLPPACSALEGSTLPAEVLHGSPKMCACWPLQVSFLRSNLILRVLPKQFGQTKDKKDIQLEAMIDYIR